MHTYQVSFHYSKDGTEWKRRVMDIKVNGPGYIEKYLQRRFVNVKDIKILRERPERQACWHEDGLYW